MSEEIKQIEGELEEINEVGSGKTSEGKDWTRYKYKVDNRTYSGFIDVKKKEPSIKVGDKVIVSYTEKQDTYEGKPVTYKNVKNIELWYDLNKGTEEANKKYNVVDVGKPTAPKLNDYESGAFFGMCSNQALNWIIHKNLGYQENFSQIFDVVWNENIKKRKEKLNE